jgi:hypothetical protein
MLGLYALGSCIYFYQFPEKYYPGRFDLIFSSHQVLPLFSYPALLFLCGGLAASMDLDGSSVTWQRMHLVSHDFSIHLASHDSIQDGCPCKFTRPLTLHHAVLTVSTHRTPPPPPFPFSCGT